MIQQVLQTNFSENITSALRTEAEIVDDRGSAEETPMDGFDSAERDELMRALAVGRYGSPPMGTIPAVGQVPA